MIQSQADIVLADMQDPHVRGNSGARAIVDTTPLFVAKPKLSARRYGRRRRRCSTHCKLLMLPHL